MAKKMIMQKETEVINYETGEVTSSITNSLFKTNVDYQYIRLNFEDALLLINISKGELQVFLSILKFTDYKNIINLNAAMKKKIAQSLNKSISTIDKSLTNIKKANLMKSLDTGQFILNPNVFLRGKEKDFISMKDNYNAA